MPPVPTLRSVQERLGEVQVIVGVVAEAAGVDDSHVAAVPVERSVDAVARRAGQITYQDAFLLQQLVQERRLPHIWAAHDGDGRLIRLSATGGMGRRRSGWPAARPTLTVSPSLVVLACPPGLVVARIRHRGRRHQPEDLVEQIANAVAVLGGDLKHGLEAELIELHDAGAGALVVGFVDREQYLLAGCTQFLRDGLVARDEPFAAVHHHDEQVRTGDGTLALLDDEFVQRVETGAVQSAGIADVEGTPPPGHGTL